MMFGLGLLIGIGLATCAWWAGELYSREARRRVIFDVPNGFVTCRCADCEQDFETYKSVQRYCPRCRGEPGISHYETEPSERYEDAEALR